MEPTEKQKLYEEIQYFVLPMMRNVQTWPFLRRIRYNRYDELELVHNLPPLLLRPEFSDVDIYWLSTQAKNCIVAAGRHWRFCYGTIVERVRKLLALVPPELHAKLELRVEDLPSAGGGVCNGTPSGVADDSVQALSWQPIHQRRDSLALSLLEIRKRVMKVITLSTRVLAWTG